MEKAFEIVLFIVIAAIALLVFVMIFIQSNSMNQSSLNKTIGLIDWRNP